MNTQPKVLKWSLIIGIMIVLNLFFNYALSLAYKQPDYNLFCPSSQVVVQPQTQNECTNKGGQWTDDASYGKPYPAGEIRASGYCDLHYTCRQSYESAQKTYDRNVFISLVILGALMVFVGNFFKGNEVVSNGFALGGVLSFIIASGRYWGSANDLIRVVILAIALGLLIWVAMKKFRNNV
jgi:hypothetical protein